jgi:osmotically-inducible protein OsmY
LNALDFEPSVDAAKIGVTAHDGVVTVRGSVKTFIEKWTAERVAGQVYGVRGVANEIEVLPDHDTRRDDSAIAEAAVHALLWDPAIPLKSIQVTLRNGWVTLTGEVPWGYQRDAAEAVVRRLYGVKGITNAVLVKPRVHVSDVKARIESAFKRSASIDAERVHVETRDGSVFLTGTVRSMAERREAERAAWSAAGVKMVDDRLAVTP